MKCIKNEEGNVLVKDGDIKERWKNHFYKLFNKEQTININTEGLITREEDQNFTFYWQIREVEIKDILKKMDNGNVMGPDNIPIELWKCLGGKCIAWLTKLFNEILRSKRMP